MKQWFLVPIWIMMLTGGVCAAASASKPVWIERPYDDIPFERYFVGIGCREMDAASPANAVQGSRDNALGSLAQQISALVRQQTTATTEEIGDRLAMEYRQNVEVSAHHEVRLAEVRETYIERRRGATDIHWTRVVMDRATASARLLDELRSLADQIRGHAAAAESAMADGFPVAALRKWIQARWMQGDFDTKVMLWRTIRPASEAAATLPDTPGMLAAEKGLADLVESLRITVADGDGQVPTPQGTLPVPLAVRVSRLAGDRDSPVGELPVRFEFQNMGGQLLAGVRYRSAGRGAEALPAQERYWTALTDAKGQVAARVQIRPQDVHVAAAVRASVDVDALCGEFNGLLRQQAFLWLAPLAQRSALFSFQIPMAYTEWLQELAAAIATALRSANRREVVPGAFWFDCYPASGPFGDAVWDRLTRLLPLHGIAITEWDAERLAPVLLGEYRMEAAQIELHWRIQDRDGHCHAENLARIARSRVPEDIRFEPEHLNLVLARHARLSTASTASIPPDGLKVDLWTNRGPRPVFRAAGETLRLYVLANRDSHAQLLFNDAGDKSYFLLPNVLTGRTSDVRLRAGQVRRFPDPAHGEHFTFSYDDPQGPFGMEGVKVIVATRPLTPPLPESVYPTFKGGFLVQSSRLGGEILQSIVPVQTRGPNVVITESAAAAMATSESAEAYCIIHVARP